MKLKCAYVEQVNFQATEATNIEAEMKRRKLELAPSECALLFSLTGEQAVLVRRPEGVEFVPGAKRTLYVSVKFRLTGGHTSWLDHTDEFFEWCERSGMEVSSLRTHVNEFLAKLGHRDARKVRAVG